MVRALFRFAGNIALWAASMAFLTAVSLLLFGSFLLLWPVMRKSPRDRRVALSVELASAGLRMLSTFTPEQGDEENNGIE